MRGVALLVLTLWPGLAAADEVFIRGGGQLTGEVVERGPDSIVVDIGTGRIGLRLSSVERIVPGATPHAQYRERAAGLEPDDVAGWLALADWARDHRLEAQARDSFDNVLAADPGNTAARRALGHVQVDGEWMTREESYRARGYVRLEGSWVSPDEGRALLEERRLAVEERRVEAEAQARVREAEAGARMAEAEARMAEVQAREMEFSAAGVGSDWTPLFAGSFHAPFSSFAYPAYPPTFGYGGFHKRHHSGFKSRYASPYRYRSMPRYGSSSRYASSGARTPRYATSARPARPPAANRGVPAARRPGGAATSGRAVVARRSSR